MSFINLTPHVITVYNVNQFVNLAQLNPTTWVADDVQGEAILSLPSMGSARISVTTDSTTAINDIPMYVTQYGNLSLPIDSINHEDILIVSLPVVSNAKAANLPVANQLVSPYQVVRKASDTSVILGCTGFTY